MSAWEIVAYYKDFNDWMRLDPCVTPDISTPSIVELGKVSSPEAL